MSAINSTHFQRTETPKEFSQKSIDRFYFRDLNAMAKPMIIERIQKPEFFIRCLGWMCIKVPILCRI